MTRQARDPTVERSPCNSALRFVDAHTKKPSRVSINGDIRENATALRGVRRYLPLSGGGASRSIATRQAIWALNASTCEFASPRNPSSCFVVRYAAGPMRGQFAAVAYMRLLDGRVVRHPRPLPCCLTHHRFRRPLQRLSPSHSSGLRIFRDTLVGLCVGRRLGIAPSQIDCARKTGRSGRCSSAYCARWTDSSSVL